MSTKKGKSDDKQLDEVKQNFLKEQKASIIASDDKTGLLPKPTKNWGKGREYHYWNKVFLQFAMIAQVLGQLVLLLFLFAFFLGGADWQPFGWAVAVTVFMALSFIYFGGLWIYITFMNPEFFWFRYGIDDEGLGEDETNTEVNNASEKAEKYHKLEKRRTERKRSFNMFMVVYIVALVILLPLAWTWLTNNSTWIPKSVGGTVPNTPLPSYIHYWRFYLNSGIELFASLTVIVAGIIFFFRTWDDNTQFDEERDDVELFKPRGVYSVVGWINYILLMVYHLFFVMVVSGVTQIPVDLLIAWACVIAFLTLIMWIVFVLFRPADSVYMRNDLRYRTIQSIVYLIIFNVWQIIFYAYYYSATTKKEKGDGHYPRFDPARAAVGQFNFYYYSQLTAVINIGAWGWSLGFFAQHAWATTNNDLSSKSLMDESKTAVYKMVKNQRHIGVYWLVFILTVFAVLLFGFSMNETAGSQSFLASRFWVWTITTTVLLGFFWLLYAAMAIFLLVSEKKFVHHWHTEPVLVSFLMVSVFVIVYIWLFAYFQNNYNDLGKAISNAAVNDPANHLSVQVPLLFGIILLATSPFLYFLVDFMSHPLYYTKEITAKESKETK